MNVLFDMADIFRGYFSDAGDIDANKDYSVAAATFSLENDGSREQYVLALTHMEITGVTGNNPTVTANTYFDLAELTNGLRVYGRRADLSRTELFTALRPIRNNTDLMEKAIGGQVIQASSGNQPSAGNTVIPFTSEGALLLRVGEAVEVDVNDDFSALAAHRFAAIGYWVDAQAIRRASAGRGHIL